MFAGDLRYRTQPVLGKLANIAAKKDYTGASFYLMAKPTNFTKIEHHLRVFLSSASLSSSIFALLAPGA
jgi:hypothetical protein